MSQYYITGPAVDHPSAEREDVSSWAGLGYVIYCRYTFRMFSSVTIIQAANKQCNIVAMFSHRKPAHDEDQHCCAQNHRLLNADHKMGPKPNI